MSDHNPHHMQTPTPRDHNVASNSEIMPFSSSKIKLWKSPLFIIAVLIAVATPFLFIVGGNAAGAEDPRVRMAALFVSGVVGVFVLLLMILLAAYLYAKPGRSFLIYMIPFVIVVAILFTPIAAPYFIIFREILPGNIDQQQNATLFHVFIGNLFGAGFMEEILKATPLLIGAYLAHLALRQPSFASNPAYKLMHLRGPLDGVLMGMFAGGGFIFFETAFDYIPRISGTVLQQTNDIGIAISTGFSLLLPRVLGGLVGHMAYSGVFGYFIGLSVIRPQQRWKLLGIGYVASTLIHTAWNTSSSIHINLLYVVAVVCAISLVACLLKARQIDGSRAGAAPIDTQGSIVVDRAVHATPAAPYTPAPQPYAPPPQAYAPPPQAYPPQAAPAAQAPPQAPAAAAQALGLDIDGFIIPLRDGGRVDPASEPALAGRGAGVVGEIVAHPTRPGVLGLRNSGAGLWTARLRDGGVQTIEPGQNVRLAPGVVIAFGADLIGAVRALG